MATNPFLESSDFTDNEQAYLSLFESVKASILPREISIFRPPIRNRQDLLKTILWRQKVTGGSGYFNLADKANFSNASLPKLGKMSYVYDDSSFKFYELENEKEFSDKLTHYITSYFSFIQHTLNIPSEPTTNYKEQFFRHYNKSIDLLLRGPPHANEHDIDSTVAEEWIQSHITEEHRRLARLLIDNTIYISHSKLLQQIQDTIPKIQEKLVPGLPIIFLTATPDKSNYYISLLFYHYWIAAGLHVDTIKVYMDEIVEGNIIDIDEMAYSGTQTTSTLAKVYLMLVNKITKNLLEKNCTDSFVESFCKSRNFFPSMLFEKILAEQHVNYILVRIFCSENGEKELLRIPHGDYSNPLKFPCHLVIGKKIPSPFTLFGKKNADKLSFLYGIEPGYPASTAYFNHKVANTPSTFLYPYAYGVVPRAPLSNYYFTYNKEEKNELKNTLQSIQTENTSGIVEFKPFIRYCLPGSRLLPRSKKNLMDYEDPTTKSTFLSEPTLPQEYRCPYAWYKRIDYETGTYSPLPAIGGYSKKTRKIRGGAGFFSRLNRTNSLPFESYLSSINRVYTFLYLKVNPFTEGYIPLAKDQTIVSQEQKDFFQSLLKAYKTTNRDIRDEDFVHDVLGVKSIETLSRQIQQVEAVNTTIYDTVLKRSAIAQSYAGSWGRFVPVIFSSEKQTTYRQNWEQHICALDPKVNQNTSIKSLSEKRCILVYHTKSDLQLIENQFQLVYGDRASVSSNFPALFVEKDYLPEMNGAPFPYALLNASSLMKTSFVLDAFINNGVKEIQGSLAETIEKEYKRLWNQYSLVKVVQHSNIQKHDIYMQKFISVTNDFGNEIGTYLLLPTLTSLDKIKGVDVQTSLQLRVRYPSIWSTLGSDPNLSFFLGLKYQEQIQFAVLQFRYYITLLPSYSDTAFKTVYLTDLRNPLTQKLFLKNIEPSELESYRTLLLRHT